MVSGQGRIVVEGNVAFFERADFVQFRRMEMLGAHFRGEKE